MKLSHRSFLFSLVFAVSLPSHAMTLNEYLNQVRQNNDAVKSAELGEEAKGLRLNEASLFYKPSFFLTGEYSDDKRPTNAPTFQGTQTVRHTFRTGFSENFKTGTKASVSYNIYKTEINGAQPGILLRDTFYDVAPQIELSQSLWRNWLGSEFQATTDSQKAQVEAARLNDQFTIKQLLQRAETAYWAVVYAEHVNKVQKESLDRAVKLRDWNRTRMRNNLVDEADYLQAEANLQTRELELESAAIDLETARREFNSIRQSTEPVPEIAADLPNRDYLQSVILPEKVGQREDVLIAKQNQKAAEANSILGRERNKPNLELYGSYSINGRDVKYSQAYDQSVGGTRPWTIVGVRFSTPMDFGAMSDYRKGYAQEKVAAELNSRRKAYEVDREWEILVQRFGDFKQRLTLSKRMEEIQQKKLLAEKSRFNQGRTTTFQVLQFEQDFANAQILRLRNEQQLINVHNQLKLFGGISHE